jgi:hypothetical protein
MKRSKNSTATYEATSPFLTSDIAIRERKWKCCAAASTREQLVKLVVIVAPDQECPLEGPPRHRPQMGRLDVGHDPMPVCLLGFPPGDEF